MEPLTFFASTVLFICAFHLLSTAVDAVTNRKYASDTAATQSRSDWYCFFSLSSLFGTDISGSDNTDHQDLSTNAIIEEHKRRQQAQRPRLHIS